MALDAYDLDTVDTWIRTPQPDTISCHVFLNAWNLFLDIAVSVSTTFDTNHSLSNPVYNKLFAGNNLPSITPEGASYTPSWSTDDMQTLQDILTAGLANFDQYVRAREEV